MRKNSLAFARSTRSRMDRHDNAVEFPNGQVVLLTDLHSGQGATVLQLPVTAQIGRGDSPMEEKEVPIVDAAPISLVLV